jgi:hypothetical protein
MGSATSIGGSSKRGITYTVGARHLSVNANNAL